jgi:hypothetical protein
MRDLKTIALGLFLSLASFSAAFAQCGTQAPAGTYCGNPTGAPALAGYKPIVGLIVPLTPGTTPISGGTSHGLLTNNAGLLGNTAAGAAGQVLIGVAGAEPAWSRTPVLGVPAASQGTLGFAGATGGTATITAQATAGSPTLTLPNTSGTFAVGAAGPLVLSATTGALTCPTCVTSSGGGAITGTAPISVSAAGVVSITSPLPLTNGGTNASLTANNGGIVWSNGSQLQIFAGTATARLPLLSGATATPSWGAYTLPASVTSGGIPYFSSTGAESSSGLLTASAIVLGGGAGGSPTNVASLGTTTTVLHGNAAGAPTFGSVVSADLNITTTTCTNQFVTAISAGAVGTCTTDVLASAQHANQGTTTTLLHGNAAGNPSFGQLVFADITSTEVASTAQYLAGTASKLVQSGTIYTAETTTTFGATTTFDFTTFINTNVTLTGNITTMTLTNIQPGKAGSIRFSQDATGSRTSVFSASFKFASGVVPTLSTAPNAVDILAYNCLFAGFCQASLTKDVK